MDAGSSRLGQSGGHARSRESAVSGRGGLGCCCGPGWEERILRIIKLEASTAAGLSLSAAMSTGTNIRFEYSSHTSRNLLSKHASDLATKLDQCASSRKGSRLCFWAMLSSMEVLEVLWQTWVLIVRSLGSEVSCSDFQGHPWE